MSDHNTPLSFDNSALTVIEGEPRMHDLAIGKALGFSQSRDIRKLIERHKDVLSGFGEVCAKCRKPTSRGGRPGTEYHLNRRQTLYITAKSDTPDAALITVQMVEVFDAHLTGTPNLDRLAAAMERMSPQALNNLVAKLEKAPDPRLARVREYLETSLLDTNMSAAVWDTKKHILNIIKSVEGKPLPLMHTRTAYIEGGK